MLNVLFAIAFTFLGIVTAFYMAVTGSVVFAFAALFISFIAFAVTIAAMFLAEY